MVKFNLMPKRKVAIADIKKYLVDEFDENRKLQSQVYSLQDELKIAKEYEVKYNLSLTTLDEYKNRVESFKNRNKNLETQIKELQKTIKNQSYEIADLKLEQKKYSNDIEEIKKKLRKEFIKEYKEKINDLKGHIKKEDLLKMRW